MATPSSERNRRRPLSCALLPRGRGRSLAGRHARRDWRRAMAATCMRTRFGRCAAEQRVVNVGITTTRVGCSPQLYDRRGQSACWRLQVARYADDLQWKSRSSKRFLRDTLVALPRFWTLAFVRQPSVAATTPTDSAVRRMHGDMCWRLLTMLWWSDSPRFIAGQSRGTASRSHWVAWATCARIRRGVTEAWRPRSFARPWLSSSVQATGWRTCAPRWTTRGSCTSTGRSGSFHSADHIRMMVRPGKGTRNVTP